MLLNLVRFAFKRLGSHPGLSGLLVISSALAIALTVAIPQFSNAVSKRIMQEELGKRVQTPRGFRFAVRFIASTGPQDVMPLETVIQTQSWIGDQLSRGLRLPIASAYMQSQSASLYLRAKPNDPHHDPKKLAAVKLGYVPDVADHIKVLEGDPFGTGTKPGILRVWLGRAYAQAEGWIVGDRFILSDPASPQKQPVEVEIAGLWELTDATSEWYGNYTAGLKALLLTSREQYDTFAPLLRREVTSYNFWHFVFDDRNLDLSQASYYLNILERSQIDVAQRLPRAAMELSPGQELEAARLRMANLSAILFGLSLPLWALLVLFIVSLSALVVHYQRRETAIFMSRGGSRSQLVALLLAESLVVLLAALGLGIALGLGLALLMGNAQSFLGLTPRDPLPISLATIDWRWVALAAALTVIARLLPNRLTPLSIVTYEQTAIQRRVAASILQILVTLLLLAATGYVTYRLKQAGTIPLIVWRPGQDPRNDPLLVLAPSLFLLSTATLVAQGFSLLMAPLARLAGVFRSASTYLGLLNLSREGGLYRMPTFMLVLSLAIGVFYASLATSSDVWLNERLRYWTGADLTFQQSLPDELAASSESGSSGRGEAGSWLLPISDYEALEGVAQATEVGDYTARLLAQTGLPPVRLLAVDPRRFSSIAYFRPDFASESLGSLMNRLSAQRDGLLMPKALMEQLQYSPGDLVGVRVKLEDQEQNLNFRLVGSFDYFPTMYPNEAFVLVTNLDYLQTETAGSISYGIWMKLNPQADPERSMKRVTFYGVNVNRPRDLKESIAEDQNKLERVGIFGMLSTCFLGGTFLASLGFIVSAFLSITTRTVRLAVLQALGMARREVIRSVFLELVLILAFSILLGAAFGVLAARLYVPHLPLIGTSDAPFPPFIARVDWGSTTWLAVAMFLVLLLIETLLILHLLRARLFELLRMGVRP